MTLYSIKATVIIAPGIVKFSQILFQIDSKAHLVANIRAVSAMIAAKKSYSRNYTNNLLCKA